MAEPVRYHVDLADRDHHLLRVTTTVPTDLAAGAVLTLSVWTPGSYVRRDYVRHVQWITARDAAGVVSTPTPVGETAWALPADAVGPVEVTFELYANELSVRTNHVDDHHALIIPAATFPYVEGGEDRPHVVHLPPQPATHRVWSLLPDEGEDTYVAEDRDHLIDAAFEVGDLPSVTFDVGEVPHTFVWAGHGGRPPLESIATDASAIAEACIDLFGDGLPTPHYTILAAAWDEGGGGLEHRDGAVLQMPLRTFGDEELTARFQSLLAHEYLHLWNVKRLTPAALTRPAYASPTHSDSLWVAEGWTAYYDELVCVRAGVWKPRRLLDTLASTADAIRATPGVGLQSLRRAGHEAWTKHYRRDENAPNAMTDYYGHGSLVAFELDLRLRAADPRGDGLDTVFRTLWRRHAGDPAGYTEADVVAAVADVGGADLAELVEDRVANPGHPVLDDVVDVVGLRWATKDDTPPPNLGVRTAESGGAVTLAAVLRDGPAWRAGLTGGDRVVALDGEVVAGGHLEALLRTRTAGDAVTVTVTRGPRLITRTVTLGEPVVSHTLRPVATPSPDQQAAFAAWAGSPLDEVSG